MVGEYEKEVFYSHFSTIKRQVETAGLKDRVIFTGYLPDDELAVLLNLSTVLVCLPLWRDSGCPRLKRPPVVAR